MLLPLESDQNRVIQLVNDMRVRPNDAAKTAAIPMTVHDRFGRVLSSAAFTAAVVWMAFAVRPWLGSHAPWLDESLLAAGQGVRSATLNGFCTAVGRVPADGPSLAAFIVAEAHRSQQRRRV